MDSNVMDQMKLASGDTNDLSASIEENKMPSKIVDETFKEILTDCETCAEQKNYNVISSKMINDNETKLKERIAQCKEILTCLKLELKEEKTKLSKETTVLQLQSIESSSKLSNFENNNNQPMEKIDESNLRGHLYASSVDSKLCCDENLLEYEKQLQKYQKTLNMAQNEKKNAIRKQMLSKAFKLKLLEVENQCNIELIRIKQSLQCLEPLKFVAEKWKTSTNDGNYDTFELIPRYPELGTPSGSDVSICSNGDDSDSKLQV